MEWLPSARLDVLNVATPPLSVTVASTVVPSLNVTVPLGVPLPGAFAVTVALNVTLWPSPERPSDDVTAVVVAALPTVTSTLRFVCVA
jgi:hypothetical protein